MLVLWCCFAAVQQLLFRLFRFGFMLGCALVVLLALYHRQVFSEDCCGQQTWKVSLHGSIADPRIEESSGLVHARNRLFWTHNDDDDYNLYLISDTGTTRAVWPVAVQNFDWEEITSDRAGHLYVGNFGNNFNTRKFLRIWKLDPANRKIEGFMGIKYASQTSFPPWWPADMRYDCEAMVHAGDSLYLFTKNKDERSTDLYALPDVPGQYTLHKKQTLSLLGMVTGAAVSPDGKALALLTYQRIYIFRINPGFVISGTPTLCIPVWQGRQMEAITYWGRDSLLITNEQRDIFLVSKQ